MSKDEEIINLKAQLLRAHQVIKTHEAEITYLDLKRATLENQVSRMCVVYEAAQAWYDLLNRQSTQSSVPWLGEGAGSLKNIWCAVDDAIAKDSK